MDQIPSVLALPSDLGLEVGGVARCPSGLDLVRVVKGGWVRAGGDVGTGWPVPCPGTVCLSEVFGLHRAKFEMVYLAGHIVGCQIKVINPSVPSVPSITLVPRN